jgi:hypothetical protein
MAVYLPAARSIQGQIEVVLDLTHTPLAGTILSVSKVSDLCETGRLALEKVRWSEYVQIQNVNYSWGRRRKLNGGLVARH